MKREIKFRGLRTDGKGWAYGNLEKCENFKGCIYYQIGYGKKYYRVVPESVGQFTGLQDKNGVDIYEGDIVKWNVNNIERAGVVYFDELQASFWIGKDVITGNLVLNDWMRGEYEVRSNIHEPINH